MKESWNFYTFTCCTKFNIECPNSNAMTYVCVCVLSTTRVQHHCWTNWPLKPIKKISSQVQEKLYYTVEWRQPQFQCHKLLSLYTLLTIGITAWMILVADLTIPYNGTYLYLQTHTHTHTVWYDTIRYVCLFQLDNAWKDTAITTVNNCWFGRQANIHWTYAGLETYIDTCFICLKQKKRKRPRKSGRGTNVCDFPKKKR